MTPQPPRFSEDRRQIVHIPMGALALLLRFVTWWEAAILAGVAVAFNALRAPSHCPAGRSIASPRRAAVTLRESRSIPLAILC